MVDTCTVTWTARDFSFVVAAGTRLVFMPVESLALAGAAGTLYVPGRVEVTSDGSGAGSAALVPATYVLSVITASGTATATLAVPDLATATIGYCIDNVMLAPTIGDVQALVSEAEAAAAAAGVSAGNAAGSAASALAIYGSVDAQNTAVATAQAQASLAAGYAASASSVVQQDLSGVTVQALHRSPNAITAMFIYDTSKDSDGGAWTERCQHTSWWNEAINGKWLGAQATEAAARAVSGAATGDYFQRTSDGRFFSLNAGSGITEVYRGNKRDFPRLAGIVAEVSSVTIYDLTEPGRPMWMRFVATAVNGLYGTSLTGASALNGVIVTTGNAGLGNIHLISDNLFSRGSSYIRTYLGNIAQRNGSLGYALSASGLIANETTNAVAMTVLPDAPVDPVTGLRVPTIAVGTATTMSIILHDGVVVTIGGGVGWTHNPMIDRRGSVWEFSTGVNGGWGAREYYGKGFGSYVLYSGYNNQVPNLNNSASDFQVGRYLVTGGFFTGYWASTPNQASLFRPASPNKERSLAGFIRSTFNTGWMTGDIRRCFLSDVGAGSVVGPATVADRSYKAASAATTGTLTKAELASGTSLMAYSGFSAANYLREPFSADLDFGTGEWTASAWVNVPTTLPVGSYGAISSELIAGDPSLVNGAGFSAGVATITGTVGSGASWSLAGHTPGKAYKLTFDVLEIQSSGNAANVRVGIAGNAGIYGIVGIPALGTQTVLFTATGANAPTVTFLRSDAAVGQTRIGNISVVEVGAARVFDRAHSSGPRIALGVVPSGFLQATVSDGTNTRTVTSSAAYNTAQWLKARVNYTTDGTLAILVNGREVAATRGTPLLTLSNASAVLTIGNSYDLAAPFPGSIALLKLGATVPTAEQAVFMFEQEKQLFRAGALSVLPDSGAIVDMAYDDATDRWVAISAANESYWTGLVRNSVQAVPAGNFSRVVAGSGLELAARTGTNPGVDVTIPAYGLREELVNRAEAAARLSREIAVYDFVGGFTANTTNGSTAIASVAGLTYPTSYIGARVSGAGIPANTTITAVSGTTIYLSAAATATATGVSVSFLDFALPVGLEAKAVLSAGALRQEGSTKDFTRLFDGFREAIRFAVAPGATAWVQIQAARAAQ